MSSSASAVFPLPLEMSRAVDLKKSDKSYPIDERVKAAKPMDEFNQPPKNLPDDKDDLKQIKGIGQTIAQALNNLGIYCYADLVDFTADRLAALLKTEIPSISPQRIEHDNWLGQARELAFGSEEAAGPQSGPNKTSLSLPGDRVESETQLPLEASSQNTLEFSSSSLDDNQEQEKAKFPGKSWRELADFFVSFGYVIDSVGEERLQTRAHYSQADKFEQWDGIVTNRLVNWMLEQGHLSSLTDTATEGEIATPAEPFPPPSISEEETLLDLFLDLSDLWVSEVKVPAPAGTGYQLNRLQAECRLKLSGPAAIELTQDELSFTVESYLVDTQTNRSKLTASYPGQLRPSQLVYEIQQRFPIPPAGRYQLYLVARLLPPGTAVTHLQGPIIRAET